MLTYRNNSEKLCSIPMVIIFFGGIGMDFWHIHATCKVTF